MQHKGNHTAGGLLTITTHPHAPKTQSPPGPQPLCMCHTVRACRTLPGRRYTLSEYQGVANAYATRKYGSSAHMPPHHVEVGMQGITCLSAYLPHGVTCLSRRVFSGSSCIMLMDYGPHMRLVRLTAPWPHTPAHVIPNFYVTAQNVLLLPTCTNRLLPGVCNASSAWCLHVGRVLEAARKRRHRWRAAVSAAVAAELQQIRVEP